VEQKTNETDIREAQAGSKEAFIRLIKACEATLYRVAHSILPADADCLDAVQEAILKAYQSVHQLGAPWLFKPWVVRILIHECYILQQKNRKILLLNQMPEQAAMPRSIETELDVQNAVQLLEADLQVAVSLFYYDDLSVKQISQILKIPEGTVKTRLKRARTQLELIIKPSYKERGLCYE
jgi:RNA polymerase sigma-70 factor, ECF subfamily